MVYRFNFSYFLLQQIATLTKSGNDLQIVLKNHRESFHKVQRKLRLVVSERDCYKQLIENYEKNVTSKLTIWFCIHSAVKR